MTRILLFGATGYAGSRIRDAALRRGHQVTAVSRGGPVAASLYDRDAVLRLAEDADILVSAITSGPDAAGNTLPDAVPILVAAARRSGVRIGVVGGAGSLLLSEGGEQVISRLPPIAPRTSCAISGCTSTSWTGCEKHPRTSTGSTSVPQPDSAPTCPASHAAATASVLTFCSPTSRGTRRSAARISPWRSSTRSRTPGTVGNGSRLRTEANSAPGALGLRCRLGRQRPVLRRFVRNVGLDRVTVVAAATNLARSVGVEKLSMRRLATELDVTPMALYRHLPNKEALLDLVVDESLRSVPRSIPMAR